MPRSFGLCPFCVLRNSECLPGVQDLDSRVPAQVTVYASHPESVPLSLRAELVGDTAWCLMRGSHMGANRGAPAYLCLPEEHWGTFVLKQEGLELKRMKPAGAKLEVKFPFGLKSLPPKSDDHFLVFSA